jgi:dihydroflavonol-4-reductase
MKAFVTGGTGFIGKHLVRQLVERGYDVVALVRSDEGADMLRGLGAGIAYGDITDVTSMRPAMRDSDVLFHLAAWYKLGGRDWHNAESINVGGTRKVLRLAQELGVPKIVYTSTVAVLGDTKGELVDENHYYEGPFLTEYDRTKWLAHYKVAVPFIEKGAPIVIVMPGGVYGPGDPSVNGELLGRFYRRQLPIIPAPETTWTYAHVEDVACGHILAAEKGRIGESYILAGPAIPLGEMVDFLAYLTGRRAPLLRLPARLLRPWAPLAGLLHSLLPLPHIYSEEAVRSLGVTYMARADKARAELGWQLRSLHDGMIETLTHLSRTTSPPAPLLTRERRIAGVTLLAVASLLLLWYLSQRRRDS